MAGRESRGDAREVPRPQPRGARRANHRLAGVRGAVLAHEAEVYLEAIRHESAARGSDVMLGLLNFDLQTGEIRNGLYSMSSAGDGWYYKRRLVPFGEFFPVPEAVRKWMRLQSLPYYDMTPGEEHQPLLEAGGERLAATICYEDAYGADQLAALPGATLLVNVTNNAWFGDSRRRTSSCRWRASARSKPVAS